MKIDFLKGIKRENKSEIFVIRITPRDLLKIKVNALLFTDGNLSEWIRYASTILLPPPHHIDASKAPPPDEYRPDCTVSAEDLAKITKELQAIENMEKKKGKKRGRRSKVSRVASNGPK